LIVVDKVVNWIEFKTEVAKEVVRLLLLLLSEISDVNIALDSVELPVVGDDELVAVDAENVILLLVDTGDEETRELLEVKSIVVRLA
jgi:hypothetical protein